MSIETTYNEIKLQEYLKEKIQQGQAISAIELFDKAAEIATTLDLSKPQFDPADYYIAEGEEASAFKFNQTFEALKRDLNVVYKEVVNLSDNALNIYERWKVEAENLEKELINIEEEIENLLLLTQDTEGYHSVIIDNFVDLSLLDMSETDAKVNLEIQEATLAPNEDSTTQIFLNDLASNDIVFKIRSNILSRSDLAGADIRNIFKETSLVWHTRIKTQKSKPVVCELIVKLGESSLDVNKIEVILHDSGFSGVMNITPLYSNDDVTYSKLPCEDYSLNVSGPASFKFPKTSMKYLKFILAKSAPDSSASEEHNYQFGFKRISLFKDSYNSGNENEQTLETQWLSVVNEKNEIQEFEKLTLTVCDSLVSNTYINYFVAAANLESETPVWYPITPVNRNSETVENSDSNIFEVGSNSSYEIKGIKRYKTDEDPTYVFKDATNVLQTEVASSEPELYSYLNSASDGILNHLLYNEDDNAANKKLVNFRESSLLLYRGVGAWKKEDPYYSCVVEVENLEGITIEAQDQWVYIDELDKQTGEVTIPFGTHKIKINKNYWNENSNSLKTLIESKVDFFAARKMEKVSVFDMLNNVSKTNYDKFAIDLSLPGTNTAQNTAPKKVFLIKKDPDNLSEEFTIKFNLINEVKKYVKVKAKLGTNDSTVAPSCDGYQIKLA